MLNPIEKFKFAILHLNRDENHCNGYKTEPDKNLENISLCFMIINN